MIVLSVSALKPSQYRKFVKGWDKGRYADLFAKYASDEKAYRFSLPLIQGSQPVKTVKVKPLKPVSDALEAAGYVVDDYIDGYAVDAATGKRRMKDRQDYSRHRNSRCLQQRQAPCFRKAEVEINGGYRIPSPLRHCWHVNRTRLD